MTYKQLGLLKCKYYAWEVHGEIRYITNSKKQLEGILKGWGAVPNSTIVEYFLEYAHEGGDVSPPCS